MTKPWIKAVLFDLDGTLADTAPDMANALQIMRTARGLPLAPFAALRSQVSMGARGLVGAGFDIGPADAQFPAMRDEFLANYENNICIETTLFAGMMETLLALQAQSIAWGIVTNKNSRFTTPLVAAMKHTGVLPPALHCGVVVCGDTTPHAKPHPAPLLHAAIALSVSPQDCIYVGDDIRDIQAAHAAGMPSVAALYGYLGTDAPPSEWSADASINHPIELLGKLKTLAPRGLTDSLTNQAQYNLSTATAL